MEREMATRSNILAWEIPWTEDPGRLQSMGSQRVGHDLVTEQHNNKNGLNKAYCTFANRQLLLDKEVELIRTQSVTLTGFLFYLPGSLQGCHWLSASRSVVEHSVYEMHLDDHA